MYIITHIYGGILHHCYEKSYINFSPQLEKLLGLSLDLSQILNQSDLVTRVKTLDFSIFAV